MIGSYIKLQNNLQGENIFRAEGGVIGLNANASKLGSLFYRDFFIKQRHILK